MVVGAHGVPMLHVQRHVVLVYSTVTVAARILHHRMVG